MHRYTLKTLTLEIVMILVAVIFFIPVFVLINLSFKTTDDPSGPLGLPQNVTFENYADAWVRGNLANAIGNSAAVTIVSVSVIIAISALAAYPLARITGRWSRVAFFGFMIGLLLPFQLALIPLYVTMRDLGLLGTIWAVIIFYIGLQAPFSIFLYTSFIRALPADYEEAARLDGCGPFAAFYRVVFPLLRPITGTVVILNTIFVWNDFLTPLLYLSGSGQQTIPVALFSFVGQYVSQWNLIFAGLVISILPILIIYFAMQRSIIKGFASGLKG